MTDAMTPEQIHAAQLQAAQNEEHLMRVINGNLEECQDSAHKLGLLSPNNVSPQETRVVLRLLRTDDGRWWVAIEGAHGMISQAIMDDEEGIQGILTAAASVITKPLKTEEERAAEGKQS